MAHFIGEVQGNRGNASRTGSKKSGMQAHIRGWNLGVKVVCRHNSKTGKDEIHITQTGGSNGQYAEKHITTITQ
jgi:hypothetical protein